MTKIHSIFPVPIYRTSIKDIILEKNLDYVKNKQQVSDRNEGNFTSRDSYILKNEQFKIIKRSLMFHVNNYFKEIISTSNIIKPYITQSWLNFTTEDQFHHHHSHTNSILSGVLYISADKKHDSINFYKSHKDQIELKPRNFNLYNSGSWKFTVETGDLFLFPSRLEHSVKKKKGNNLRISLAFNVFVKGLLGKERDLNELSL
jgi:uncharacterized protein (TIGR02466 family)|tara:strand:- start:335 stop:943 length:609 start_codon:yes stop_codon:yes gene_type:complete